MCKEIVLANARQKYGNILLPPNKRRTFLTISEFCLLFLIQKAQLIVIIVDDVVDGFDNIMDDFGSFCYKIPESHSCNVLELVM